MSEISQDLIGKMQRQITVAIKRLIDTKLSGYPSEYRAMVDYQLGLDLQPTNANSTGKRLRPLFVLLTTALFGEDWRNALPAACAVELLHNFSLVHDDIQDSSEFRRGRQTVWRKWGVAQAINAGDALLNLAYLSIFDLQVTLSDQQVIRVLSLLQETCLKLTRGQHLDMMFEDKSMISLDDYWQMIQGKTAALLSASFAAGAIIAGAKGSQLQQMEELGTTLGLAFQVQDDFLGIWGDERLTGKSIYSDLITRKKSYPVVLGLEHKKVFAGQWTESGPIDNERAREMAIALEEEGIKKDVQSKYKELYNRVLDILVGVGKDAASRNQLLKIVRGLQDRTK